MGAFGNFRDDINGLRAVAVLGVLFFHLGVPRFGGGFLGVDVFFVISGYLITGSIAREAEARSFSFLRFYYRRARRLLPALLATVLATLVAGSVILAPLDLRDLGKSATYALAWLSNFYFWQDASYFAADAGSKALLHTWSLGVEEQFYLVWPLLLLSALRMRGRCGAVAILLIVFASSFVAAQWIIESYPTAAFFLMPFRIFEFAIGGLVVLAERRAHVQAAGTDYVVAGSLAAIVAGFLLFNEQSLVPVLDATLVCIATAALIYIGPAPFVGKILSNPLAAFLGRISYSLYLVHWPIIVLYRYSAGRPISSGEAAGLFVATVLTGWLLHVGVEQRFRYYDFKALRPGRYAALASLMLAFLVAGLAWYGQGWAWRSSNYFPRGFVFSQTQTHRYELFRKLCASRGWKACWAIPPDMDGKKLVVVTGDSHAADGFNMIYPALGDEYPIISGMGGCPPIAVGAEPVMRRPITPGCKQLNGIRTSTAYLARVDVLVISVLWGKYTAGDLRTLLERATQANPNIRIIVFGNYFVTNDLCWRIIERFGAGHCFDDRYIESRFLYEEDLRAVTNSFGGLFLSKQDVLCHHDTCRLYADDAQTIPLTWDKHHLSYEFAEVLGQKFKDMIREYVYGQPAVGKSGLPSRS